MPAGAPAEVSSVTVCSCWDVIPALPDMLTGVRGGRQRRGKTGCVKGSWSQDGLVFCFYSQSESEKVE